MKSFAVTRACFVEALENRRLLAADLVFSASFRAGSVDPGQSFNANVVLADRGSAAAGAFDVSLALSESGKFGDADNIPLATFSQAGGLPAHKSVRLAPTALTVPANAPIGSYHLVGKIDVADAVAESNENNNVFSSRRLIQVGPVVSISALQRTTSPAGAPVQLTVTRSGADLSSDLVVSYSVTGTAVAGADFAALPGTVTIPAGRRSAVVTLAPVNNPTLSLASKTVTVTISAGADYNVSPLSSRAAATIAIDNRAALLNGGVLIIPGATTSTVVITPAVSPLFFTNGFRTSTLGVPTTFDTGTRFMSFNGSITTVAQLGSVTFDSFSTLNAPFVLAANTPFFFVPVRLVIRPVFVPPALVVVSGRNFGFGFGLRSGFGSFFFFNSAFSSFSTRNSSLGLIRTNIDDPLSFTTPVFT